MSRKVQQSKRVNKFTGNARTTRVPTSKCGKWGKQRYRYRKDAMEALLNIRIVSGLGYSQNRNECRAYRCDDCNGWHLTSQQMRNVKKSVGKTS